MTDNKLKDKMDIMEAIVDEYVWNNYEKYGTCENCVFGDDENGNCKCNVAKYDGDKFVPTGAGKCIGTLLRAVKWKPEVDDVNKFYVNLFLKEIMQRITTTKEAELSVDTTEKEINAYIKGLSFTYNIMKDFLSQLEEHEGEKGCKNDIK